MTRLSVGALLLIASVNVANAVVGTLDTADTFPFVVQVEMTRSDGSTASCSGAVAGHVLSTAAHCLYESDEGPAHGWAKKVVVSYVDVFGRQSKAYAKHLSVPQSYIDAEKSDPKHLTWNAALHDLGYAVLDREVLVKGYIHWGVELLAGLPEGKSECAEPECMDWGLTPARKAGFLKNVGQQLGDLNQARTVVVGYGNFACEDYSRREEGCRSDGRRRYVELPLQPNLGNALSAPWLWCTGEGILNTNPIQHGDSGGAVLVQARDGRWIFVGYTSRGNSQMGCAASMFNDLNLWRDTIAAYDEQKVQGHPIHPTQDELFRWYQSVTKQFFNEWLRNESAPADLALQRYSGSRQISLFFGKELDPTQLNAVKKLFFEKWPEREFYTSDVNWNCDLTELNTWDTCTINFTMNWKLLNRNENAHKEGQSKLALKIHMPFPDPKTISLGVVAPEVTSISGDRYDGQNTSSIASIAVIKSVRPDVSEGHLNLRTGPSVHTDVVAQIPAGEKGIAVTGPCVPASDGSTKNPWCPVKWNRYSGWASESGLR